MFCIVVLLSVVDVEQWEQTLLETVVVLVLGLAPLYLAEGCHTWQLHVFYVAVCRYVFAPQVCLYTNDVLLYLGGEGVVHRFERVYLLNRYVTAYGKWLVVGILCLVVVEVHECGG